MQSPFEMALSGQMPEEAGYSQVDRLGTYYRDILEKVRMGLLDVDSAMNAMTNSGYMDSGWNNRPGGVERQRDWLEFVQRSGQRQRGR